MLAERVKDWTRDWKAQGIEEGLEKGLEEGHKEGAATLERRFGPLEEAVRQRIRQAGSEELERLADRILDAGTLEEVFAGPA